MKQIYKLRPKATICNGKQCVTVFDDTAEIVNGLVVTATVITVIAFLGKILR